MRRTIINSIGAQTIGGRKPGVTDVSTCTAVDVAGARYADTGVTITGNAHDMLSQPTVPNVDAGINKTWNQ